MEKKSISLLRRRLKKFRSLKRGYYSFLILTIATLLSFANPLLVNSRALIVKHDGAWYFPAIAGHYEAQTFGQRRIGEANYRELQQDFAEDASGNWVLMPPYPFHPNESLLRELSLIHI